MFCLKPIGVAGEGIKINTGRQVIGRGPLLGCTDKRVSRNHGILDVNKDGTIVLESTHVNPCYYQKKGKGPFFDIVKSTKQKLEVGDRFSLLPNDCKFEIVEISDNSHSESVDSKVEENNAKEEHSSENKIEVKTIPDKNLVTPSKNDKKNGIANGVTHRKRVLPSWLETIVDETVEDEIPSITTSKIKKEKKVATTQVKKIEDQGSSSSSSSSQKPKVTKRPAPSRSKEKAKTPNNNNKTQQKRPPCTFGDQCYRQNPIHFLEQSHPGEPDYVEPKTESSNDEEPDECDDIDDRPECEFGLNCYRKNPEHKKAYKHTTTPRPQRAAAKRARAKTKEIDTDEDDDDSFIADDDSDVYDPDSDEDIPGLIAEANKFKRNKKLMRPT